MISRSTIIITISRIFPLKFYQNTLSNKASYSTRQQQVSGRMTDGQRLRNTSRREKLMATVANSTYNRHSLLVETLYF